MDSTLAGTRNLLWLGHRESDALSFFEAGIGLVGSVACFSSGLREEWPRDVLRLSLDSHVAYRGTWSSNELDAALSPRYAEILDFARRTRPQALLPYRSCSVASQLAKDLGIEVLAPPEALIEQLSDKIWAAEQLYRLGLSRNRPSLVKLSESLDFSQLKDQLGVPFVARLRLSCSGKGCFKIGTVEDFQRLLLRESGESVVCTAWIEGPTNNFHAVVGAKGQVAVAPPSRQLSGIPGLALDDLEYLGNAFLPGLLDEQTLDQVACVEKVGQWLSELGFRGLFGVDVMTHRGIPDPIDLNPRLQGSTFLLTQIEQWLGLPISLHQHVRAFGGTSPVVSQGGAAILAALSSLSRGWLQIYIRSSRGESRALRSVPSSAFRLRGRRLEHVSGWRGVGELSDSHFLVVDTPLAGTMVQKDALIGRIIAPCIRGHLPDTWDRARLSANALEAAIFGEDGQF
jgi:hypothetical protein